MEIKTNPLFRVDEMWRGIETCLPWEAGPFPESSEKGLNECTCASFTLGPCNMDDIELIDLGRLFSVSRVRKVAQRGIPSDRSGGAIVSFQLCLEYP